MKKIYFTLLAAAFTINFSFAQWSSGSGSSIYYNSGNVGITTTNPLNNLQVGTQTETGTSTPVTLSLGGTYSSTAGANPKLKIYDNGTVYYGFGVSSGEMDAMAPSAGSFAWYVNGSQKMILNSSGNVGIGTATPANNLQIGTQASSPGSSPLTFSLGGTYSSTAGANPKLKIYDNGTVFYGFGVSANEMDAMAPSGSGFAWFVNGSQKMILNSSGNVGIGTATVPTGYAFAVNGSAVATSMVVKLAANWPDFVFKKDYLLPSLSKLKTYIDQNHHLPEMPTEQEINKDGLNLGDMNKLLVKKVEELTLYLIDKDSKIKDEDEKIKQQDDKISKQQTELTAQQAQIDKLNKAFEELTKKLNAKN